MCLRDIGEGIPWSAVKSFIKYQTFDSVIVRDSLPEMSMWSTTIKTNLILADIFDLLNQINANIVAIGNRKPAKKNKPYKRPFKVKNGDNEKHFGKGALPVEKLEAWFEQKRGEWSVRHD